MVWVFVLWMFFLCEPTLSSNDAEVSCRFGQNCILPCSFTSGQSLVVHWYYLTPTQIGLHSYYENKDQWGHQDQKFRGRTSLFQDQISKGNASLQLKRVMVQDEGKYRCYTSTTRNGGDVYINMNVYAPPQKINMKQTENQIICSSDGIYPKPGLSWSISPASSRTFQNTTRVQQTEELLYNISSSLILSDSEDDLDYICTISTPSNQRRSSWRRGPSVEIISGGATLSCSASDSSLKGFSLVWSFNQNQMIVTKTEDDELRVSEEWKQHVKDVSESGRLTLQHLSADHRGTYTCEVSKDEETNITQVSLRTAEEPSYSDVTIIIVIMIGVVLVLVIISLVIYCKIKGNYHVTIIIINIVVVLVLVIAAGISLVIYYILKKIRDQRLKHLRRHQTQSRSSTGVQPFDEMTSTEDRDQNTETRNNEEKEETHQNSF